MLLKNNQSADLSNMLYLSISNLGYPRKSVNHYALLLDEALGVWKKELNTDSELCFERTDTDKDAVFYFSVKDRKLDPFSREIVSEYQKPVRTMYDKLTSGIGTELKYRYRRGENIISLRLPKQNQRDTLYNRTAMGLIITFALQLLVQNIASNIDVLMLGFLSSDAMSGVAFASQLVLIHTMLTIAVTSASSTLFSQLYGQRKTNSVIFSLRLSVIAALVINLVEFALCFFMPATLLGLYTDIPELVSEGSRYLKIVSVTFLLDSFYVVFYSFLQVIDKQKTVTRMIAVGCAANVLINAVLIFGLMGIPSLGTVGAAAATVVASFIQLAMSAVYYLKNRKLLFYDTDNSAVDKIGIRKVFFSSAPTIMLQYGVYLAGLNVMTAAIGRLNADIIAAYSFIITVNSYLYSVKDGCGKVATILTGMQLGRNNFEEAKHNSLLLRRLGVKIGIANMAALTVLIFALQLMPLQLSAAARQYLLPLTAIACVNAFFGYQNCINNGVLYAGGEARSVFTVDAAYALCVSLPIALVSIKTACFAPMLLMILGRSDETITFIPKMLFTNRGKWLRNIIDNK